MAQLLHQPAHCRFTIGNRIPYQHVDDRTVVPLRNPPGPEAALPPQPIIDLRIGGNKLAAGMPPELEGRDFNCFCHSDVFLCLKFRSPMTHVDDKAVANVALRHALESIVDMSDTDRLNLPDDVWRALEILHGNC